MTTKITFGIAPIYMNNLHVNGVPTLQVCERLPAFRNLPEVQPLEHDLAATYGVHFDFYSRDAVIDLRNQLDNILAQWPQSVEQSAASTTDAEPEMLEVRDYYDVEDVEDAEIISDEPATYDEAKAALGEPADAVIEAAAKASPKAKVH